MMNDSFSTSTNRQAGRVAIVGAGIAGLNAALTLRDAGMACQVYEAADYIGGRIHSDATTWGDGMATDLCGEFIDNDHETMLDLARRFGLHIIDLGASVPRGARSIVYLLNRYYDAQQLGKEFDAISPILRQQREKIDFPTTYDHYTETARQLDQMSAYDWIEQYVPGGHDSAIGRMFYIACNGFYGLPPQQQSALNLVYFFGEAAPGIYPATGEPNSGSYKIAGGNQQLPLAIAHSLPENTIKLQHQLVGIRRDEHNTVVLSFMAPDGFTEVLCDHAILTLPFSILREIDYRHAGFDDLKQTAIRELGYGTISKLFLQFDTRYWDQPGPWPSPNAGFMITDLETRVFWDTSLGQPGPNGLLVDYAGGLQGASYVPEKPYSTTNDSARIQEYAQASLTQLEKLFPGISSHYTGNAALSYPPGNPFLRGSYSCWGVGQYTRFAGYERVRQGPIHFAGEHCSLDFQGYMEGAAREGERAAREVLEDYG